jgi:hypothetical protein
VRKQSPGHWADLKGPYRVSNVRAVRDGGYLTLSWTNPPPIDFARTTVRWYAGSVAPDAPDGEPRQPRYDGQQRPLRRAEHQAD